MLRRRSISKFLWMTISVSSCFRAIPARACRHHNPDFHETLKKYSACLLACSYSVSWTFRENKKIGQLFFGAHPQIIRCCVSWRNYRFVPPRHFLGRGVERRGLLRKAEAFSGPFATGLPVPRLQDLRSVARRLDWDV